MEMEVNKVASVMTELFKKCRRKPEQAVRDFNMEFERLLLRLGELNCELPALVIARLYLDRLNLGRATSWHSWRTTSTTCVAHNRRQSSMIVALHDDRGNALAMGGVGSSNQCM
jgi:hypothetical protein